MRNLRIRLTLSYVLIFALVLITTGILFRQVLIVILYQQTERVLIEEWGALKGFLHLRQGEFVWAFDPADAEESFAVERLRRVLMLANRKWRAPGNLQRLWRPGRRIARDHKAGLPNTANPDRDPLRQQRQTPIWSGSACSTTRGPSCSLPWAFRPRKCSTCPTGWLASIS